MATTSTTAEAQVHGAGVASCKRWREFGEAPELLRWKDFVDEVGIETWNVAAVGEAVVLRHAYAVECIVTTAPNWHLLQENVTALIHRGWMVTVVTPLSSMGHAHEELRGTAARIQGWWTRESDYLFSPQEIA